MRCTLFLLFLFAASLVATAHAGSCMATDAEWKPASSTFAQCQGVCPGACVYSESSDDWSCYGQQCGPNTCAFNACGDPENPCAGTCVDGTNEGAFPEDSYEAQYIVTCWNTSFTCTTLLTVSHTAENLRRNEVSRRWQDNDQDVFENNSNAKFQTSGNRTFYIRDEDKQLYSKQDNLLIGPYTAYQARKPYYVATIGTNQQVYIIPENLSPSQRPYGQIKLTVYNASVTEQKLYSFTWVTDDTTYLTQGVDISVHGRNLVMIRRHSKNSTYGVNYINLLTRKQGRKEFSTGGCDANNAGPMWRYQLTANFKSPSAPEAIGALVWVQGNGLSRPRNTFSFVCVYDIDAGVVSRTQNLDVLGQLATQAPQFHPEGNGVGRPTLVWRSAPFQSIPVEQVLVTDLVSGESRWINHELEQLKWRFNLDCEMKFIQSRAIIYMKNGVLVFQGRSDSILAFRKNTISIIALKIFNPNNQCKTSRGMKYEPAFLSQRMGFLDNNTFILGRKSVEQQGWVRFRLTYLNSEALGTSPPCPSCSNPRAGTCVNGVCMCNPGCSGTDCSTGDEHCQ